MAVTVWFDYTCGYSYRVWQWLNDVQARKSDLFVNWATFSLKEKNRAAGTPSILTDPALDSVSVRALALSHAARAGDFPAYHRAVFEAMHGPQHRTVTALELNAMAADAGVDVVAFEADIHRWRLAVAAEHTFGHDILRIFGTPTLVHDSGPSSFVKLAATPDPSQAVELWNALQTLSVCHPELVEIKSAG